MSNISKLKQSSSASARIFAETVELFSQSQGFYGRLIQSVNELDDKELAGLEKELRVQDFQSPLDVVLWVEC